ncbi:MAG: sigma-70 family RNA polymerase sigma factor [Desulfomonile sp.]|nr:sigma-70 family RNA polymerase sigma factor [Desulfomonile sp.]
MMRDQGYLSDEILVKEARDGSEAHFNALVDRYIGLVYRVAFSVTGSAHEAEDVVQETFLRVFRNLDGFDPSKAAFKTWLLAIARNQSINVLAHLKRKAARFLTRTQAAEDRDNAEEENFPHEMPDAETTLLSKERTQLVQQALAKLPEKQRTALMLKAVEGLSYAEIAEILHTSASAVESLIYRARSKILEEVEQ